MTVNLSALAGAGQQFFDNVGNTLSGGKLWSYQAGTTTPQTTYTTSAGNVAHTNPIILDSAGRVPGGEIWLTAGVNYKFVLMTSANVTLATWDNIYGINVTSQAVNVRQYGAVGDGVTDDTTAIQAAHNTGKPIYYPPGTYRMNSQVTLSGVDFIAISENAVIQSGTDGLIRMFEVTDSPNTLVQGLTFDANSLGKGFLYLVGCAGAQIRGNEFKNFKNDPSTAGSYHAIQLQYCPDTRVTENIFQNIGEQFGGSGIQPAQYRAISQETGCDKTIVSDNVFQSVFGGLYLAEFDRWLSGTAYVVNDRVHFYDGVEFSLYRCTANHTASGANEPPNASFWALVRSNTQPTEVSTFSGNVCRNIRDNAVYHIEYVKSITITGNSFVSSNDEPIVVVSDSVTITGNTFRNTRNKAISLELGVMDIKNVTISGNTFVQDNTAYSIGTFIVYRNAAATNTIKTLAITGNTFKSNFSIAPGSYILLRKCENLVISGNSFDIPAVADEILIRALDTIVRGVISNNVIQTASTTAIIFRNDASGSEVLLTDNLYNGRILANTTQERALLGVMQDTGSNIYIQDAANRVLWGAAAPTTGAWSRGDIIWNVAPANNGVSGWVCISAGSPGTWGTLPTVNNQTIGAGWTPTLTNVANLDSSTASFSNYARIGSTVVVSGQLTLDPTATGSISLRMTLPIAMDFTATRQAAGVVSSSTGAIVGSFNADATNDQILITANATTISSTIVQFSGTYTLA
jgi:hypothetical protein